MDKPELQPWQVEFVSCSDSALGTFVRSLMRVGGHFYSSFNIGGKVERDYWAAFMVKIPVDREAEFEQMTGYELRPVARLCVGTSKQPPWPYKGNFINEKWPEYMK